METFGVRRDEKIDHFHKKYNSTFLIYANLLLPEPVKKATSSLSSLTYILEIYSSKAKYVFCNTNRSGIHSTQHKELELQTSVVSIITQHFSEDSAFRILLICIKLSLAFTDPTDKYFVLIEHFRGAQIYWFAFTEAGVRCSHCRSQLSDIG